MQERGRAGLRETVKWGKRFTLMKVRWGWRCACAGKEQTSDNTASPLLYLANFSTMGEPQSALLLRKQLAGNISPSSRRVLKEILALERYFWTKEQCPSGRRWCTGQKKNKACVVFFVFCVFDGLCVSCFLLFGPLRDHRISVVIREGVLLAFVQDWGRSGSPRIEGIEGLHHQFYYLIPKSFQALYPWP